MDFWDLVPFIVGAIYLFGRGKGKDTTPASPPPKQRTNPKPKTTQPDFEEVLRELMGDVSRQPKVVPEVPVPQSTFEERAERRSYETPVKKKKEKTIRIENVETNAWSYDDHIEDELKEKPRPRQELDRHFAVDEHGLKAEDIDLRNVIIYDAIFRRPEY